jgi:hypothetical protein
LCKRRRVEFDLGHARLCPSVAPRTALLQAFGQPDFLFFAMWRERSLVALYVVREQSLGLRR